MKVVILDNSMMHLLAECSTEALLTMLGKREQKPNGALQVGTLIHSVVAKHFKGIDPMTNLEELESEYEAFRGEWLFSPDHVGPESTDPDRKPQYALMNVRDVMIAWMDKHPQPSPIGNLTIPPEWVEIAFEYPLEEFKLNGEKYLLVISGQLDALGEEGNELVTVENKSVGRIQPWWKLKFEGDSQNTEYQWAAELTTGREVTGTYLNAIETGMLPNSSKTCYKHTYADLGPSVEHRNPHSKDHPMYNECRMLHAGSEVFYITRNSQLVVQWKKDAISLAKKYVELAKFVEQGVNGATKTRTQGKFHDVCMFCNFRNWCIRSARDPRMVESMMADNTEHREVRVGIFEEDEWNQQSSTKQSPTA